MFNSGLRQDVLNYIRSMLPIDTGNLRYNGTTMTGSNNEVEYRIGDIMAEYIKYHEDNPNSPHYNNIKDNVAPSVYIYLEMALNGKQLDEYGLEILNEQMAKEERENKINQRNKVFYRSLARNNVSIDDVLGR